MRITTGTRICIFIVTVLVSNVSLSWQTRWKTPLQKCLATDPRSFLRFIATFRSYERRPIMSKAEKDRTMDIMLSIARGCLLPRTRKFFWPWRPWRPWWRPTDHSKPGFHFVGLGLSSYYIPSTVISSGGGGGMHPYNAPGYGPGYPNAEPLTTAGTTTTTTAKSFTISMKPLTTPNFPPETPRPMLPPHNGNSPSGLDGADFNNGYHHEVGYYRSNNLAGMKNAHHDRPRDQTVNVDKGVFNQEHAAIDERPNSYERRSNDYTTHNFNTVNPNTPLDHWNLEDSHWNPADYSKSVPMDDNDHTFY